MLVNLIVMDGEEHSTQPAIAYKKKKEKKERTKKWWIKISHMVNRGHHMLLRFNFLTRATLLLYFVLVITRIFLYLQLLQHYLADCATVQKPCNNATLLSLQ